MTGKRKRGKRGYFGRFGGCWSPEILMPALSELEAAYTEARSDKAFQQQLSSLLRDYAGRPTPLFQARRLSDHCKGASLFLKREDLLHTGAHKINNALGQVLLARFMGKKRVIAETGAGQHGVATATAAALLGLSCDIYMGSVDMRRQRPNVFRMNLLGTRVIPVESGSQTLKDAVNEAFRDWTTSVQNTHYVLGSALGPHPFPTIVRDFQSVIGRETKRQMHSIIGRAPDEIIACVGGGSNAIGIFSAFIGQPRVRLFGVEAGGLGLRGGKHAVRLTPSNRSRIGILHGTSSYILQDVHGQIAPTHSISAGLDYSGVGPEHAFLYESGRAEYRYVTDKQAIDAFRLLSEQEGIIPALESAHAVAFAVERAQQVPPETAIVVNISGRGDKDLHHVAEHLGMNV